MGRRDEEALPCSSIAVDHFLSLGAAGCAWGIVSGPYEAQKIGLAGTSKATFVMKSMGKYGAQCGIFGALLSATQCGLQKYRMKKDWVNASVAGALTGAIVAARTRSLVNIAQTAAIVSGAATLANYWQGMNKEDS